MNKNTRNFNAKSLIRTLITIFALAAITTVMVCAYSVVKPQSGDYYICASSDNGYCLDVTGGSASTGAYIQLWQRTSNNGAQIFSIKHYSGDWYRIVNKSTGHIINVPGANSANGQQLWMWSNDDYTNASLWRFLNAGNGNYIIQNKMGRVIDLDNNLIFSGSRVHLWSEHGGASCRWKLVSTSGDKKPFGDELESITSFSNNRSSVTQGTYKITLHDDSSYCLNVIYKSTEELTSLVGVDTYNSETNEQFVIIHRGSNYYSIHPKHASYLCLNAKYANKTPGDSLTLYTYEDGDNASLWSFHKYSDGTYAIKNKATSLVIDIANGHYYCGNKAINWTANEYMRAQAYKLTLVSYDTKLDKKLQFTSPMKGYWVTQSFGNKGHMGVDIKSNDTTVYAVADGEVCYTGLNGTGTDASLLRADQRKGNGYCIVIKHNINGKTVYSFYAHLKKGSTKVSYGQKVTAGTPIATMGNTGNSTGPHLHFAIANGYSSGAYYGYTSSGKTFYDDIAYRNGITFYDMEYVLKYNKLP